MRRFAIAALVAGTLSACGGVSTQQEVQMGAEYAQQINAELPIVRDPAIDLYVTASAKEGLPLALLEAMGAGLAVVATDVPGHRDVVRDGETGLLVPAGDVKALAAAIATLIDDPDRRRRMGQAGRERVRKEFGIRPMVERTAEIYRAAAATAPR